MPSCVENCYDEKSQCRSQCRNDYDSCISAKNSTGKDSSQCLSEKNEICFKACTTTKDVCKSNCATNR